MSAITGIFYRDGYHLGYDQIIKMNNLLSHRGPDGSKVWSAHSVALGHQMLHTTPESLHESPPYEEDGLIVTADARIDNRKELSAKLGVEDQEEFPDSYFILKSYQKWNEKCPEKLLGDFAFAIWDKDQEKLFCARDHLGVKPFYYYLSDELFLFASEIKAIKSMMHIKPEIDQLRVAKYLTLHSDDKEETFYRNVLRLPAGFSLSLDSEKHGLWRYWKVDPEYELELDSDEEYSERFLEIFMDAVKCRLRSAYPIGSMLSGGLDSSSIVSTACKILDRPIKTFSAIFNEVSVCDESYYIQSVIDKWNVEPYFIHGDKLALLPDKDRILWHLDDPLIPPNIFLNWNINKLARKNGVRVLLDGYDGDTVVSHAREFITELAVNMRWLKLFKEIEGYSKLQNINRLNILFGYVIAPLAPQWVKKLWGKFRQNKLPCGETMIKEEFADQTDIFYLQKKLNEKITGKKGNAKDYHHHLIFDEGFQGTLEILDKTSSAFSIEPRYPFLDKRLVEFCLALPTEQKRRNGWDRAILRRSMDKIIPDAIKCRSSKSNLAPNFNRSLLLFEKEKIESILNNSSNLSDYINIEELMVAYDKFKNPDNDSICGMTIWLPLTLALWLNKNETHVEAF